MALNAISLFFASKIQLPSIEVCCKVSLYENIQRQHSTSFLYQTVHRWIAGDISIYLKFALRVIHPWENADFDKFRLIVAQPWELAKSSIIANRKSTIRFPSSHRWTLCVTPKSPKGCSKREFLHSALPFISSSQVIVDTSKLVCGLNIASPSLQTTNWPWKGRGHCHVIHFKFQGPKHTSRLTEARIVKSNVAKRTTYHPLNGRGYGHLSILKFCLLRDAARRAGSSSTAALYLSE